ncbi:NAD kinase [Allocoprobacillus halotolerans]|uniref:NAD kinase n=1 Tax=Allocoprobacillus halotolerans TaxID=2944914 RepID=A0ABY5I628_9FIRM|nr:NAD kinase [Allocoprobacillus halotolerans]UTY39824.1 NAD kinase [Allocoprobacillus halotolerans]
MKTYAIVCKQDQESITLSEKIKAQLNTFLIYNETNPDIVISVGGDGTMLYSVHKYIEQLDEVAFIGIHTGTLGFLTDYQRDEYQQLVEDIKKGEYHIYERHLLEVTSLEGRYLALNEVRVENNRRSQVIDVYINDDCFETFRGNGLCVSTASGSTAYNKSLGGAVINSGAELMQLSEIAGIHHNAYRSLGSSLILDKSHTIRFQSQSYQGAILGVDQLVVDLKDNDCICIQMSTQTARFLQYKNVPFTKRLKRAYLSS